MEWNKYRVKKDTRKGDNEISCSAQEWSSWVYTGFCVAMSVEGGEEEN